MAAVWPLNILQREGKRKSNKIKRARGRKWVCWLCSVAGDEENAPVAAAVHRGGETLLRRPPANPVTSLSFAAVSPRAPTMRCEHLNIFGLVRPVSRPSRTLVHPDPKRRPPLCHLLCTSSNTSKKNTRKEGKGFVAFPLPGVWYRRRCVLAQLRDSIDMKCVVFSFSK